MEANEIQVMKDAARRMQEFLTGRGITVGHAVALEALTASLGARNWRTVREKLSATSVAMPVAPAPAPKTLADFPDGRWTVRGRDYDGGLCGDYFSGETPLEAKMSALYYRLFNDSDASFEVCEVIDRLTDEEVDTDLLSFSHLHDHGPLFVMVLTTAKEIVNYLYMTETNGLDVMRLEAIVATLRRALDSRELIKKLNDCNEADWDPEAGTNDVVDFATDNNGMFFAKDLESALQALNQKLKDNKGRMSDAELRAFYQYEAFYEFFGPEIRKIFLEHFSVK